MTAGQATGGPVTGPGVTGTATAYTPVQLARLLGLPEPTAEQAAVIGAPPRPLAVIAGAGSGKSETMAARLVWLVANGAVRPERVLGLTFTRKAAAELGQRVRARLDGLRKAGLSLPGQSAPGQPAPGQPAPGQPRSPAQISPAQISPAPPGPRRRPGPARPGAGATRGPS